MNIFQRAALYNLIAAAINFIFFFIGKNPFNLMLAVLGCFIAVIFIVINASNK